MEQPTFGLCFVDDGSRAGRRRFFIFRKRDAVPSTPSTFAEGVCTPYLSGKTRFGLIKHDLKRNAVFHEPGTRGGVPPQPLSTEGKCEGLVSARL